jgi:hypothetical protein
MRITQPAVQFVTAVLVTLTVLASHASAQQAQRLRGEIENVTKDSVTLKTPEGKSVKVMLDSNASVTHIVPMALADIKPGMFVGSGAMPDDNGGWKAAEVHVFAPGTRPGEGHRPWSADPAGSMTNADVSAVVVGSGKDQITLTVNGQSYDIKVPPEAPVVRLERGNRDLLKPGAWVGISNAVEKDGVLSARSIAVSEDRRYPVR